MQTRLSLFCDKVIEAGWLAAAIVAPLFFNAYSRRVFEPDKLTLVRSIAVVMALAWLVKAIEQGLPQRKEESKGASSRSFLRIPLVAPTLALALVYVIATLTSVTPQVSLLGSYQRLQGTYTTLSYMVIFLLMVQSIKSREQVERLVTVVILTSLPISLFGTLQHHRLDPLLWQGDVSVRVSSTMGNPIFVAAYLIMALPLTLGRLVDSLSQALELSRLRDRAFTIGCFLLFAVLEFWAWTIGFSVALVSGLFFLAIAGLLALYLEKPFSQLMLAVLYTFTLVAQAVSIFFAQSRGPWLGLLGGLFFFALLWALRKGKRNLALGTMGLALLGALFLVVLNLPNSPLERMKDLPYLGRLGRVFETEGGTGRVRVLIWSGATKLVASNPWRTLIGYGPEAMYVAYNPFYPPDLAHYEARNASPDRSHNETFDALVITGLVGLMAYLFLFGSLFYCGLRWLGLITTGRERQTFIILWLGGGAIGALLPPLLTRQFTFSGVGLPFGLTLALVGYIALYTFLYHEQGKGMNPNSSTLPIALMAALIAHFIEIHFGIAIASTRTHFWLYTALLVAIGYLLPSQVAAPAQVEATPTTDRRSRRRTRKVRPASKHPEPRLRAIRLPVLVACSLLAGLILLTASYDLITVNFDPGGKGRGVMQVILATWFVCGLAIVAQSAQRELWGRDIRKALYALGIYGLVAGLCALIFAHLHLQNIRFGRDAGITVTSYYLALFAGLLATAVALAWPETALNIPWVRRDWYNLLLYPLLGGGTVLIIYSSNLSIIKADIYYNHGLSSFSRGRIEEAIILYRRALNLAPKEDFYYFELARSLQRKSREAKTPEEREAILKQAIVETDKARELNPLNTDHTANLGRLYLDLAAATPDPRLQAERLDKSLDYFQKALQLSPNAAHLWNELAAVYLAKGNFEQGIKNLQHSLSLDAKFDQTYLALGNAYLRQGMLEQAEEIYKQAVKFNPGLLPAHSGLSLIYANRGDFQAAITESLAILKQDPNNYDTHKNLSLLYRDMGNLEAALAQAKKALEVAPEGEKPKVEEFIRQLEAQKAALSQPPGTPPKSGG